MRSGNRQVRRWAGGLGIALGLTLLGGATAWADGAAPTPPPTRESITLTPEESAWVCDRRIPAILTRIDKVTARINGAAEVAGSTEWLKVRQEAARKLGRTERADALAKRIEQRPAKLDRLAEIKQRAEAFAAAHCGS